MNPAFLNIPFVQIALPIMVTFIGGIWLNSKSMDTMNKRLDDVNRRFDDVQGNINGRFNNVNRRFDEMIKRFDNLNAFMRITASGLHASKNARRRLSGAGLLS